MHASDPAGAVCLANGSRLELANYRLESGGIRKILPKSSRFKVCALPLANATKLGSNCLLPYVPDMANIFVRQGTGGVRRAGHKGHPRVTSGFGGIPVGSQVDVSRTWQGIGIADSGTLIGATTVVRQR